MSLFDTTKDATTEEGLVPIVHPEIQLIDGLFRKIESGRMRIPAFQRPFVWKPADMIALFESIQRGYPIGSLLLWETSGDYRSRDGVGPIRIPAPPEKPTTYILDGQQRLSTLFGTLRLSAELAERDDPELWIWRIYYDLVTERFTHARSLPVPPHYLPLRAVLRTSDYLRFTRALSTRVPDKGEELIERADRLIQQIAAHRFSVTRIEGGGLTEAVEIFSRLNTSGRPMKPDEMVSALTYREGSGGFHLARRIDEILERLSPSGFGEVSRVLVFRTVIAAAGENILRTDWTKVVERLGDKLAPTVERAERAMLRAADFLANEIGVPGEALLPYGYQFVLLSHFFGACEAIGKPPSEDQLTQLIRWFWATSFSGWFAGANSTQIEAAVNVMEQFAKVSDVAILMDRIAEPARPLPDRFDLHSARVRVLILTALRRLRPRLLSGEELGKDPALWVSEQRRLPRLFRNLPEVLFGSPANRLFLPRAQAGQSVTAKRLLQLPENIRDEVLRSHGIEGEALDALRAEDAPRFIKARSHHLAEVERAFMTELGLTLPAAEFGATEIDTGEE